MSKKNPIGVFDSGFGGLTVLKELVKELPDYDFIYLGDNARAPYGNRSFEAVYEFTFQCVNHLFEAGSKLVIVACNTASAKALRSIQQNDLPQMEGNKRVLGVIRPTTEIIGSITKTKKVGIFATTGTVASRSYVIEIEKFFPEITVFQEACPMWVPIIENNEINTPGAAGFVKQHVENLLKQSPDIDTIILGCTHYPLLISRIKEFLPPHIQLLPQGEIVAKSLKNYLNRHPEIDDTCSKNGALEFLTTGSSDNFDRHGELFFGRNIKSKTIHL